MKNTAIIPRRVLVVDDDTNILFAMREYFAVRGYEVDCASEVESVEKLLTYMRYLLVVVDMKLTGIKNQTGIETIAYVRERCPWTRVVVLNMTDMFSQATSLPELQRAQA